MKIDIRLEEKKDYRVVEEITREAFWNVYVPGATEHFLVHSLRKNENIIPELNFVALIDEEVVGHIFYSKAEIIFQETKEPVLTFGPLSVNPKYQGKGIGKALIDYSKAKASELGYKAIVIYGNPMYYKKVGFKNASEYGISRPDGVYAKALLAMELFDGALDKISGSFFENISSFEIKEVELQKYDSTFPLKEKKHEPSQDEFLILVDTIED